jgi:hypothetical protein
MSYQIQGNNWSRFHWELRGMGVALILVSTRNYSVTMILMVSTRKFILMLWVR